MCSFPYPYMVFYLRFYFLLFILHGNRYSVISILQIFYRQSQKESYRFFRWLLSRRSASPFCKIKQQKNGCSPPILLLFRCEQERFSAVLRCFYAVFTLFLHCFFTQQILFVNSILQMYLHRTVLPVPVVLLLAAGAAVLPDA